MTDKQINELLKVRDGDPYTKGWNFWASLARQGIVRVHSKPRPKYGVDWIEITDWGNVVLDANLAK